MSGRRKNHPAATRASQKPRSGPSGDKKKPEADPSATRTFSAFEAVPPQEKAPASPSATVTAAPATSPLDSAPGPTTPSATLTAAPGALAGAQKPLGKKSSAAATVWDSHGGAIALDSAKGPISPSATITAASPGATSSQAPQPWTEAMKALPARESTGGGLGETDTATKPGARVQGGSAGSDFVLREKIGAGGQGEIWRAWQTSLGREVAVKRLRGGNAAVGEFLMEALTTAELDHPNIVPVHDLGRVRSASGAESPLIAMKLARGTAWNDLLRRERESPDFNPNDFLARHLRILADVCDAVAYAHAKRIIHRDLKPHQVIVGAFGEVFLIDWGLAVGLDDEFAPPIPAPGGAPRRHTLKTATNQTGTPAYMAPEQTRDSAASLGVHTDVYLLGAILFELLTGEPPHPGDNARDAYEAARDNIVRELPEGLPTELAAAARKALSAKPEDRFASVADFKKEIESFLSGSGRRRESETIAEEVAAELQERGTLDEATYSDLTRLRVRLARALQLWPESPRGLRLREVLLAAHARRAAVEGDLRLAESLAEELADDNPDRRPLLAQVRLARRQAERERRQRILALAACGLLLAVLAVAGGAFALWQKRVSARLADANASLAHANDRLASANSDLARARDAAEQARQAAESARAVALDARGRAEELMDFMLRDMRFGLEPIGRLDLLEQVATKALGYYESRGQDDADLENRVQAFFNIGEVLSIRRQTPRAVEAFRQAQALVERMIQLEPHRQDWKNRLASARANVAAALSEGSDNQEEVLAEFQAAEEILTRALEVDPNDVDALSIFIALKRNAGYFLSVWKEDYEAGVAATREAIALAERLAALDPDNINRRARVASLRINLGADLSDLDRLDEALENYREGLAIARDLLQREPDNVQWKDLEALFQSEIGSSLRYLGRWPEAREALEPSIAKLRALAALDPTNVNWRVTLARALRHLSAVAVEQENYDWEEALKLQNEARAALGEPEDYLSDRERAGIALGAWDDAAQLAMALERWEEASGYLEQGIALAERLAPISEASAKLARTYLINRNFYYNSACLHSLAGRVEQGFQRFAQTLESGYDNFDHIATDPDLENLRQADAERFASLLEQARAAAQKESAEPSEQQPQGQSEAPSEDQPETPSEVPSADAP